VKIIQASLPDFQFADSLSSGDIEIRSVTREIKKTATVVERWAPSRKGGESDAVSIEVPALLPCR
jgi:hypothetical protein